MSTEVCLNDQFRSLTTFLSYDQKNGSGTLQTLFANEEPGIVLNIVDNRPASLLIFLIRRSTMVVLGSQLPLKEGMGGIGQLGVAEVDPSSHGGRKSKDDDGQAVFEYAVF